MSPLPGALPGAAPGTRLRRATGEDLPEIVALLADDPLGRSRESADDDLAPYRTAFALIDADPHQLLVVAEIGGEVVATLRCPSSRGCPAAVRCGRRSRGCGCGPTNGGGGPGRRCSAG